ncbi:hypothetical protein VNO78_02146 [Psophocarpus tetragonolobus]|uniref:Uncharacterized protein n=1 Tax=Psophocarpus tetragonolobus TaxID=3891 RepID=A0AAN9T065_PSOTE
MVLTPAKLPRNRTRECEYDIYRHLQESNRFLKSRTKKVKYFNTLLKNFVCKDPECVDPDLVQFMDALRGIVKSKIENISEEKDTDDGEEDVMVDPQYKYFMDHVRHHGKSYVLDIPEDGVCVVYEPELSSFENTAICTTHYVNPVSNQDVNACSETKKHVNAIANSHSSDVISNQVKRRGRSKGVKLSLAMNGNVKSSDMTSKPPKHVSNSMGKRKSKRQKTPSGSAELGIKDSDGAVTDKRRALRSKIVKHCSQISNKTNASTSFKEKLMEELRAPYCEEEYKRLLHDITVRKPVQHHKDLRGRIKIYEEQYLGKSFLDHNVDLAKKIETARDDHPRVLNLLRGYFYWLKNLSHEEAFTPWTDPSCLDVLPQQLKG